MPYSAPHLREECRGLHRIQVANGRPRARTRCACQWHVLGRVERSDIGLDREHPRRARMTPICRAVCGRHHGCKPRPGDIRSDSRIPHLRGITRVHRMPASSYSLTSYRRGGGRRHSCRWQIKVIRPCGLPPPDQMIEGPSRCVCPERLAGLLAGLERAPLAAVASSRGRAAW
jgi:hypothetical protein